MSEGVRDALMIGGVILAGVLAAAVAIGLLVAMWLGAAWLLGASIGTFAGAVAWAFHAVQAALGAP